MIKTLPILILMLFPFAAFAQEEMTLEKLLDLNAQAMGGKETLENIRSVETRATIIENGTAMSGHFRANRDGQMRVDIYVEGARVFSEALSSKDDGWQQDGEGEPVEPLSEKGKAALQNSIISNLYALHELPALGYQFEFIGVEKMMDRDYYALDITRPDGLQERRFFDMETYLKAGSMDDTALHVDVDPTLVLKISTNNDYRDVGGIMQPFGGRVIEVEDNKVIQVFELHEIEYNQPLENSQFLGPN